MDGRITLGGMTMLLLVLKQSQGSLQAALGAIVRHPRLARTGSVLAGAPDPLHPDG
jgi:hypothetical protein